jgi:hypothetical protein
VLRGLRRLLLMDNNVIQEPTALRERRQWFFAPRENTMV